MCIRDSAGTLLGSNKLESHLLERAGIPFFKRLVTSSLDKFGLPRNGVPPLKRKFKNTGRLTISLEPDPEKDERRLSASLNLGEGFILGESLPNSWKQITKQISKKK